jgi:hypothetical protein
VIRHSTNMDINYPTWYSQDTNVTKGNQVNYQDLQHFPQEMLFQSAITAFCNSPCSLWYSNLALFCPQELKFVTWHNRQLSPQCHLLRGSNTGNTLCHLQFLKYAIILHVNMTLNMLLPAIRNVFLLQHLLS